MTLPGLDRRQLHSRIKGRHALERRLRALQVAVYRFAQGRASTPSDLAWCARVADGLRRLLDDRVHPTEDGTS